MAKLGPAGQRFANDLAEWLNERDITLDPQERLLCIRICKALDRIARLDRMMSKSTIDAETYVKLVREERGQSLLVSNLIAKVGLPTGLADWALKQGRGTAITKGKVVPIDAAARQRQRAALARWANHEYSQRPTAKAMRKARGLKE